MQHRCAGASKSVCGIGGHPHTLYAPQVDIRFTALDQQRVIPTTNTASGLQTRHRVDFVTRSPGVVVAVATDEYARHRYTNLVRGVSMATVDGLVRAASLRGVMSFTPDVTTADQPVSQMRFVYLSVMQGAEVTGERICAWLHTTPPAALARWASCLLHGTPDVLTEGSAFALPLCVGYPPTHLLLMVGGGLHPLFQFEQFIGTQPIFSLVQ